MNSQELRALQEAYSQVYELNEASPSNPNLYKGKQGQTSTQYMAGRSDAGKIISGDDKSGPLGYSNRYINDEPTQPGQRTTTQRTSKSMKDADLEYGRLRYKQSVKDGNKFGGPKGLPKPKGGGSTAQLASGSRSGGYTVGGSQGYGISNIKLADSYDLYDIILSHLLDEGYADTEQAAEAIMVNMSEDWRESIMERREHDEPGEDDRNPDVRSHNRAVGYKSKPKQNYGSYDKRDRGGSEEDHEKSLGLQNLMRSVQGGSVKKSG